CLFPTSYDIKCCPTGELGVAVLLAVLVPSVALEVHDGAKHKPPSRRGKGARSVANRFPRLETLKTLVFLKTSTPKKPVFRVE
ncbi:MAG: hypothetical protein WCK89_11070, partial [bacterium]